MLTRRGSIQRSGRSSKCDLKGGRPKKLPRNWGLRRGRSHRNSSVLRRIEPKWHDEFMALVRGEEVSKEFLEYVERDARCQQAVDLAMEQVLKAFTPKKESCASLTGSAR